MKILSPLKIEKIDIKIKNCIKILMDTNSIGISGKIKVNKKIFNYEIIEVKNDKH